jgi:SAM-dependent MidA family methyltransferase
MDGPAASLARLIRREGPVPFDVFVEHALYGAGGFFASGRGAGRDTADFITSPEVGPLFGALVATAIDGWWDALERPDPFVVVEAGAGRGRLASDVLRATPACLRALRYVLVERSPALRDAQRERLRLEPPDEAFGPFAAAPDGADASVPVPASGPVVTALDELPGVEVDGVVFANELLDNLPFGIAVFTAAGWAEVRVALDDDRFVEMVVPARATDAAALGRVTHGLDVAVGARLPIPRGIDEWIRRATATLHHGFVVLLDTMDTAAGVLARGESAWLRTYRGHARSGEPLVDPGSRDLVSDVVVEQLHHAAADAGFTVERDVTQADWLAELGIDAAVADGRDTWEARAAVGDLVALEGRSRAPQAAALTDPAGLGAHRVVVLSKGTRPRRR